MGMYGPPPKLNTASGNAPSYSARAWVNFNGTGTVAIRASGNVSSITDNGTGDYTVNFTTAMPDVNYASIVSTGDPAVVSVIGINTTGAGVDSPPSASAFRFDTNQPSSGLRDQKYCHVAIFR